MHLAADVLQAAERFAQQARAHHVTVATAESCTAGGIGYAISAIAGSSDWLIGGLIAYSNQVKQSQLQVPAAILTQHGAVSSECAEAMAVGAQQLFGTDLAIAVTGVAGPGGGAPSKPVGMVWFGFASADRRWTECHHFNGDRAAVREQTILTALVSSVNSGVMEKK